RVLRDEAPAGADEVEGAVDRNSHEPGLERTLRVEAMECGRGSEEGVLRGVVRELAFARRRVRGPPDPRPVAGADASEGIPRAAACREDEIRVRLHQSRIRTSAAGLSLD